jgi:hypothetical protein
MVLWQCQPETGFPVIDPAYQVGGVVTLQGADSERLLCPCARRRKKISHFSTVTVILCSVHIHNANFKKTNISLG